MTLTTLGTLLVASAVAMGAGGVATQVFRSLGLTIPTGYSSDGSAANRAAARQDADSLVGKVALPAGARQLTSEPSGDNGYLKPMHILEGDAAHVTAHGWWQVPEAPSQVIAFVRAHPPAGATQSGSGGFINTTTGTNASSISFHWPGIAGVVGGRMVTVTVTSLPNGDAGALVESQSDWVVLRPSSERIPSATRRIELSSTAPGSSSIRLSVRQPRRVRASCA